MKFYYIIVLLILIGCTTCPKTKNNLKDPVSLKDLKLKGNFYEGAILQKKLKSIIDNSNLDSIYKTQIFKNIEYYTKRYSKEKDIYNLTQTPENFLFCDLNHDKIEDLVFQSNGPFILDSHMFIIILSSNSHYNAKAVYGQISEISETEEYCCRTEDKKEKYLKIQYFNYGCCDDPWNDYETAILNLNGGRLRVIESKSINSTIEKVRRK